MKLLVLFAFCLIAFSGATLAQNKSVYTSTKTNTCRTIESNPDEESLYEGGCKGVGGYKIRLMHSLL